MTRFEKTLWLGRVMFRNWCPEPKCRGGIDAYDHRPDRDYCTNCSVSGRDQKFGGLIGLTRPLSKVWRELDSVPMQTRLIGRQVPDSDAQD